MAAHWRVLLSLALLAAAVLLVVQVAHAQEPIPSVSGTSDAFVEAWVDLTTPWLGQQITYTFRYYEAIDGGNLPSWIRPPDYEAPEFAGFWVEGEPDIDSVIEERDGRTYNVAELRTVLFPTAAGSLTIPPAHLILYDLFERGERSLETLPVPVEVRQLPAAAPDGFDGAIGDLTLTAQTDRAAANVGDPILLRLTLTGLGNLRLVPAPVLADLPGWRVLEQGSDALTEVVDGQGGGTRTFDYMLIAGAPGSITIPPISLFYFHPASGEFRTTQTQPIVLTAEGAAEEVSASTILTSPEVSSAPAEPSPEPPADSDESAPRLPSGAEALVLREASANLPRAAGPLRQSPLYWTLWGLPAAALALGLSARRGMRQGVLVRRSERNAERSRAHAGADAARLLQPPVAFATPHEAASAAQQVLVETLQRKLARPIAGLSHGDLGTILRAHGAPPELADRVLALLRQGNQLRYAPLGMDWSSAQQIHAEVAGVLRDLDRGLR